ncbi:tRNA (N(6)-L-threonylcarbamoyladenosine(37)-C(2))-methylthiotransferase [Methanobacterium aggregans]|uniref:tRNA (N(6)-L-threonylcarbamoyladenosine(37)-C(2))- methylthiotransferase n=1 Tax=Methanobacterium aggregans TaxID=1615586 RepID=UPI00320F6363
MKIYIETFGCTFNQADSQIMAGLLKKNGQELVENLEEAELLILNTCYVKQPTEQKIISRMKKIQDRYPEKKLVITGCMVEIDPEKLEKAAPLASWIGPHKVTSTPEVIESISKGEVVRETGYGTDYKVCLPKIRSNPLIHIIQICEGCDGNCSYCCTRFARGSLQSYPEEMIVEEARSAVEEGCVEIQITAQDTAAYGKDTGASLSHLINEVAGIEGDFRIRVGMMHPKSMMNDVDGLVEAFKNPRVYKFLHIPIQSGSDGVLMDMNRGHSVEEFMEIAMRFRSEIPEISIATDIIVGYPTEEDSDFAGTMDVIERLRPDFLNISKYMHRPGTRSSALDEIDHKTMKARSKSLTDLKSEIGYGNNLKLECSTQTVTVTGKGRKGGYMGRTNSYKQVIVSDAVPGSFISVDITLAKSTYLMGIVK